MPCGGPAARIDIAENMREPRGSVVGRLVSTSASHDTPVSLCAAALSKNFAHFNPDAYNLSRVQVSKFSDRTREEPASSSLNRLVRGSPLDLEEHSLLIEH